VRLRCRGEVEACYGPRWKFELSVTADAFAILSRCSCILTRNRSSERYRRIEMAMINIACR
jgi:hypothetical protein